MSACFIIRKSTVYKIPFMFTKNIYINKPSICIVGNFQNLLFSYILLKETRLNSLTDLTRIHKSIIIACLLFCVLKKVFYNKHKWRPGTIFNFINWIYEIRVIYMLSNLWSIKISCLRSKLWTLMHYVFNARTIFIQSPFKQFHWSYLFI